MGDATDGVEVIEEFVLRRVSNWRNYENSAAVPSWALASDRSGIGVRETTRPTEMETLFAQLTRKSVEIRK